MTTPKVYEALAREAREIKREIESLRDRADTLGERQADLDAKISDAKKGAKVEARDEDE